MSRRPETLSSANLDWSVKSIEAHRCLVQETCSIAQDKRADGAIKWSPEGVVARGRPGRCILDTDASV
ncbi:hypothetical protein TNCV_1177601 [Trichonephila clavipes]|nr:hypothetical protein TNCV_1177601 [Trichonephila clavipes]